MIFIQPYMSWEGHYKIYSESLLKNKSDFLISIFMPNLQKEVNDNKGVRSLNLSVACGIAIYEAHKQINF